MFLVTEYAALNYQNTHTHTLFKDNDKYICKLGFEKSYQLREFITPNSYSTTVSEFNSPIDVMQIYTSV